MNIHTDIQAGRSMVEILGVLAVIGVLSIAGIMGYKYAMDKYRANLLVQESHLAYANAQGGDDEETNWIPVSFTPKNGYAMFTGKDEDGDTFVRVEDVEQKICRLLLPLGGNDQLRFFHEIEHAETNMGELIECPSEPIDIVIAFNGSGAPGKNCETNEECAESESGYCNAEAGICYECPENTEPSPSRLFCNPICDRDIQTECWADNVKWCCPNTQVCGENANECPDSDGFCEYQLKEIDLPLSAECVYEIMPVNSYEREAECIYEIMPINYERQADCWYTIPTLTTGDTLTLSEGKGCSAGQYCIIKSEDINCSKNISASKTGIVYGACATQKESNASCSISATSQNAVIMKEVTKCPDNKYCYVSYGNNTCKQTASPNHTGLIYGACAERKESSASCPIPQSENVVVLKEITGCSGDRYCAVTYSNNACGQKASANHTGRIYGACAERKESSASCPPNTKNLNGILSPVVACPEAQYCYLNYKSKGCSETVGATGANPFFGLCLDKDTNRLVCPTTE